MKKQNQARELSDCETMIMKLVWDSDEDIAVQQLIVRMKEAFGKDYARTTMVTFLKKIADKGYISTYRIGRAAYVHAEKDMISYSRDMLLEELDFWYGGEISGLLAASIAEGRLPEGDAEKIKELVG
ncbi:MAG: BlaI/MecI/CopY family transcriptional regulator [Clostridiales bacterium]|nr:BlaI/MecI/CopY family transcriptional regulator [Clostridiales bacterium]